MRASDSRAVKEHHLAAGWKGGTCWDIFVILIYNFQSFEWQKSKINLLYKKLRSRSGCNVGLYKSLWHCHFGIFCHTLQQLFVFCFIDPVLSKTIESKSPNLCIAQRLHERERALKRACTQILPLFLWDLLIEGPAISFVILIYTLVQLLWTSELLAQLWSTNIAECAN